MSYRWTNCQCGKQATRACDDCGEPLCDRCMCDCLGWLVDNPEFEDPAGAW